MTKNDTLLHTPYLDLIRGKKFNKEEREIIFDACRDRKTSELNIKKVARGDFDAKQMVALLKLYNSDVAIIEQYRKQYLLLEKNQFNGEEMSVIVDAMIEGLPCDSIDLIMDSKDQYYMAEVKDSFTKEIPYEIIEKYYNAPSLLKVKKTKEAVYVLNDDRILDFFDLPDDLYAIIAQSMMLGIAKKYINYALSKSNDSRCVDTILVGVLDGLMIEELDVLIKEDYNYIKMTSIIDCYKEYYLDSFCANLKDTSNDLFTDLDKLKDSISVYMLELNQRYIDTDMLLAKTEGVLSENMNEAYDEYFQYYLDSLKRIDWHYEFKVLSLLTQGEAYIDSLLDNAKKDKTFYPLLYFECLSNKILQKEYTKLNQFNYDSLLKDIIKLDYKCIIENQADIVDKLHYYADLENHSKDLVLISDDKLPNKIFRNSEGNVLVYVTINKDSYRLDKIEISYGKEKIEFLGKDIETLIYGETTKNRDNKESGKEKRIEHDQR